MPLPGVELCIRALTDHGRNEERKNKIQRWQKRGGVGKKIYSRIREQKHYKK
jgi:hypothetical protein